MSIMFPQTPGNSDGSYSLSIPMIVNLQLSMLQAEALTRALENYRESHDDVLGYIEDLVLLEIQLSLLVQIHKAV